MKTDPFAEDWVIGWSNVIGYMRQYIRLPTEYCAACRRIAYWEDKGMPIYRNLMGDPYLIPAVFKNWWNKVHKIMQYKALCRRAKIKYTDKLRRQLPRPISVRRNALLTFLDEF